MNIAEEFEFLAKEAKSGKFANVVVVADEKTLTDRDWAEKTLVVVTADLQFKAAELFHGNEKGIEYFVSRAMFPKQASE